MYSMVSVLVRTRSDTGTSKLSWALQQTGLHLFQDVEPVVFVLVLSAEVVPAQGLIPLGVPELLSLLDHSLG